MNELSETLALPVERLMTSRVVMILEDIPMREVRSLVARYDYNGFPVVTPAGRLVGMITKGDLLRAVRAGIRDADVWGHPVWRWMAHGVLALRATDTLEAAVSLMVDSGLRSLPVIDDDSRVIGMLSSRDLVGGLDGRARS